MPRPNVAPRPACRYYGTPRGCFAGPRCHYLHSDPTYAPYEQNKTCRFFARGFCKRGADCWFAHVEERKMDGDGDEEADSEEGAACSICFEERPALYGLLNGCSHAFCLSCIRQWRDPEGKGIDIKESTTHKTCPMCRHMTPFITPSSMYYAQGDPRKKEVISQYKQSMAKVPCRYFTRSKPDKRLCPFGRDCFYQHLNSDGTRHEFAEGVETMMQKWKRRGLIESEDSVPERQDPFEAALEVLENIASTLPEEGDREAPGEGLRSLTRRTMLEQFQNFMLGISRYGPVHDNVVSEDVEMAGSEPSQGPSPQSNTHALPSESLQSDDPRTPENASRAGELVNGDFAWMMGERADEGRGPENN